MGYSIANNGSVAFQFVDGDGFKTAETYTPNRRGGGGRKGPPNNSPPPRDNKRPPRDGKGQKKSATSKSEFEVSSTSLDSNGMLSVDCTCDGKRESPAVAWENLPNGTKSVAISLWHTGPDQEKSYWVVYNISANVSELKQKSTTGAGKLGINDRKRAEYDPMCSKGPGLKTYHITVFALSGTLKLSPSQVSRAALLGAVKDITLGETTLDFEYERK